MSEVLHPGDPRTTAVPGTANKEPHTDAEKQKYIDEKFDVANIDWKKKFWFLSAPWGILKREVNEDIATNGDLTAVMLKSMLETESELDEDFLEKQLYPQMPKEGQRDKKSVAFMECLCFKNFALQFLEEQFEKGRLTGELLAKLKTLSFCDKNTMADFFQCMQNDLDTTVFEEMGNAWATLPSWENYIDASVAQICFPAMSQELEEDAGFGGAPLKRNINRPFYWDRDFDMKFDWLEKAGITTAPWTQANCSQEEFTALFSDRKCEQLWYHTCTKYYAFREWYLQEKVVSEGAKRAKSKKLFPFANLDEVLGLAKTFKAKEAELMEKYKPGVEFPEHLQQETQSSQAFPMSQVSNNFFISSQQLSEQQNNSQQLQLGSTSSQALLSSQASSGGPHSAGNNSQVNSSFPFLPFEQQNMKTTVDSRKVKKYLQEMYVESQNSNFSSGNGSANSDNFLSQQSNKSKSMLPQMDVYKRNQGVPARKILKFKHSDDSNGVVVPEQEEEMENGGTNNADVDQQYQVHNPFPSQPVAPSLLDGSNASSAQFGEQQVLAGSDNNSFALGSEILLQSEQSEDHNALMFLQSEVSDVNDVAVGTSQSMVHQQPESMMSNNLQVMDESRNLKEQSGDSLQHESAALSEKQDLSEQQEESKSKNKPDNNNDCSSDVVEQQQQAALDSSDDHSVLELHSLLEKSLEAPVEKKAEGTSSEDAMEVEQEEREQDHPDQPTDMMKKDEEENKTSSPAAVGVVQGDHVEGCSGDEPKPVVENSLEFDQDVEMKDVAAVGEKVDEGEDHDQEQSSAKISSEVEGNIKAVDVVLEKKGDENDKSTPDDVDVDVEQEQLQVVPNAPAVVADDQDVDMLKEDENDVKMKQNQNQQIASELLQAKDDEERQKIDEKSAPADSVPLVAALKNEEHVLEEHSLKKTTEVVDEVQLHFAPSAALVEQKNNLNHREDHVNINMNVNISNERIERESEEDMDDTISSHNVSGFTELLRPEKAAKKQKRDSEQVRGSLGSSDNFVDNKQENSNSVVDQQQQSLNDAERCDVLLSGQNSQQSSNNFSVLSKQGDKGNDNDENLSSLQENNVDGCVVDQSPAPSIMKLDPAALSKLDESYALEQSAMIEGSPQGSPMIAKLADEMSASFRNNEEFKKQIEEQAKKLSEEHQSGGSDGANKQEQVGGSMTPLSSLSAEVSSIGKNSSIHGALSFQSFGKASSRLVGSKKSKNNPFGGGTASSVASDSCSNRSEKKPMLPPKAGRRLLGSGSSLGGGARNNNKTGATNSNSLFASASSLSQASSGLAGLGAAAGAPASGNNNYPGLVVSQPESSFNPPGSAESLIQGSEISSANASSGGMMIDSSNRSSSVPPMTLEVDLEKTQNSVGQGVEHVSGFNIASQVVALGVHAGTGSKNVQQGAEQEDHNCTPVFNTPSADGLSQQVLKDSALEQKLALELQNKEQNNSNAANDVGHEDVEMTDAFQQEPAAAAAAVHLGGVLSAGIVAEQLNKIEVAPVAEVELQKNINPTSLKSADDHSSLKQVDKKETDEAAVAAKNDHHDAENDKKKHDKKHVRFASPVDEKKQYDVEPASSAATPVVGEEIIVGTSTTTVGTSSALGGAVVQEVENNNENDQQPDGEPTTSTSGKNKGKMKKATASKGATAKSGEKKKPAAQAKAKGTKGRGKKGGKNNKNVVHDDEDEEMKDHADVLAAEQKEQSAAGTSSPFATTTSDGTKDQPNNGAALEEQVGDELCSVPPPGNDVGTKPCENLSVSPTTEGGANKQTKIITSPPVVFATNSIPRKSPQKPLNNKAFKKLKRNKKINVAESSDEEEVEKNADKTPVLATLNNGGAKKGKMNDKNAVLNLDHSDNEEEMKTKTSSDEKAHHPSKKQKRSSISMAESKSGPNNKNRIVGSPNHTTPAPAAAPLVQAKGNAGGAVQISLMPDSEMGLFDGVDKDEENVLNLSADSLQERLTLAKTNKKKNKVLFKAPPGAGAANSVTTPSAGVDQLEPQFLDNGVPSMLNESMDKKLSPIIEGSREDCTPSASPNGTTTSKSCKKSSEKKTLLTTTTIEETTTHRVDVAAKDADCNTAQEQGEPDRKMARYYDTTKDVLALLEEKEAMENATATASRRKTTRP
ncbi:unnamed protein product [Amoebophrya sp. A120]|nr:unnamed protein product [Amoebophrya sp. A120]|eukprot:GSA120T00013285001.1